MYPSKGFYIKGGFVEIRKDEKMVKIKLTYKDSQEREETLKALEQIFVVKKLSKEYIRNKAVDVYAELELKSS